MSANVTEQQLSDYRAAFKAFDTDGEGYVAARVIGSIMRSLGENPNEAEINDILNEFDAAGTPNVDFDGFVSLMITRLRNCDAEEDVRAAYRVYDIDGNGFVLADELKKVISFVAGDRLTAGEIDDLFSEVDVNADGRIPYDEFRNLALGL